MSINSFSLVVIKSRRHNSQTFNDAKWVDYYCEGGPVGYSNEPLFASQHPLKKLSYNLFATLNSWM